MASGDALSRLHGLGDPDAERRRSETRQLVEQARETAHAGELARIDAELAAAKVAYRKAYDQAVEPCGLAKARGEAEVTAAVDVITSLQRCRELVARAANGDAK
jgi:hypothetical protein